MSHGRSFRPTVHRSSYQTTPREYQSTEFDRIRDTYLTDQQIAAMRNTVNYRGKLSEML